MGTIRYAWPNTLTTYPVSMYILLLVGLIHVGKICLSKPRFVARHVTESNAAMMMGGKTHVCSINSNA